MPIKKYETEEEYFKRMRKKQLKLIGKEGVRKLEGKFRRRKSKGDWRIPKKTIMSWDEDKKYWVKHKVDVEPKQRVKVKGLSLDEFKNIKRSSISGWRKKKVVKAKSKR
jgi:hypothetical protein